MDHTNRRHRTGRLCVTVPALLLALVPAFGAAQGTDSYVGQETCLECHEDQGLSHTVHGRLADWQYPGGVRGCESCHGPGAAHAESNEPADILVPRAGDGGAAAVSCLACHKTGMTRDWELSAHAENDMSCLDCHSIHVEPGKPLLAKSQPALCLGCHADQKAAFQLPSHHPVREGFMTCTDCHDHHGPSFAGLAMGEPSRELCLNCHQQYRGPFIFEHSPVQEDCSVCHAPHGAVANNLLQQNEPFLCLQCHQPHFHSGLMSMDGDYSVPSGAGQIGEEFPDLQDLSGTSHSDSFKRVMMTKCSQCHMSVHGTDLPSQSIPGQGRALNR